MRVLVVTLPEQGHYHPLLGPAAELRRRGAEVAFACTADIGDELRAAGAELVFVPDGAAPPSDALRGRALAELVRDRSALRGWIRELLVDAPARDVEPLRAIVRRFRPDAIAIDTMAYAAAIAAELERVPWVGWSTSLNPVLPAGTRSDLVETLRSLDSERAALFARYGCRADFRVSDVLAPRGTAVFSTEALVGPAPRGVRLVGPSLGGRRGGQRPDPARIGDLPLVYASFGSQAWHQPRRFELVVEAALQLGVALVAAMGELASSFASRGLPDRIVAIDRADQLATLTRASAIVTHGGANSVMEALAHGVPLLVAPICNDQPHNGAFVERAGAGLGIDLDTASVAEVAAALAPLLHDGPERAAARRIAASYANVDGSVGAADLVVEQCA